MPGPVAAGRASGVMPSGHRNKMNEIRPHTVLGAAHGAAGSQVFGVAAEDVSFVDLLAASLRVTGSDRRAARGRRRGRAGDGRRGVLLGLALRNNPRRAQLLVSRVLGKHVPTDPRLVRAAGLLLGALVADALAGRPPPRPAGRRCCTPRCAGGPAPRRPLHVAAREAIASDAGGRGGARVRGDGHGARALRRRGASAAPTTCTPRGVRWRASPTAGGFTEEHSHATEHLLLPADPGLLAGPGRWCWSTTS